MAKVEQQTKSEPKLSSKKSNKKRKNKDIIDAVESPSGKFKKIDINDDDECGGRGRSAANKRNSSSTSNKISIKNATTARKRKHSHNSDNDDDDHEEDNNDEIRQPTVNELAQINLPENILAIKTKRQQKRQKHQELSETKQQTTVDREQQRNYDYLHKWTNNRSEWKFEKLRQISIQNNMFNDEQIDDDLWEMTKEYLSGTKGSARLAILKKAEEIISQLDEKIMQGNLTQNKNYERAREILQYLQ